MKDLRYVSTAAILALAACSSSYPVDAVFASGKLQFRAKEKLNGCLWDFRVQSDGGEVMWQIEGPFRNSPCTNNFPLTYGEVPSGLTVKVAAKPLRPGVRYKVEGYDGDRYYGAFTYQRTVVVTNTPEVARSPF